jgi:regulator of sigma E protease
MHLLIYPATVAFLALPDFGEKAKNGLIDLVAILFVLGVLVFVHEFGHYAVAKLCGVRVETFSLGFGKRLWGFRRGETDYRISLLPLGGYVKMAGESPLESRTGDPGEFTSHPRWQRFLIAIAGPAMNILLAIVVWTGVFMTHDEEPAYLNHAPVIGAVEPGSPADKAGIKTGDKITHLQDLENPNWQQVILKVMLSPKQSLDVAVQRGNQVIRTTVVPEEVEPDQMGFAGWRPVEPAIVGTMESDRPAAQAGMQPGDEIAAANGAPIQDMSQFTNFLQEAKSNPVQLTVIRDGKELHITVTPQLRDDTPEQGKRYRIGFGVAQKMTVQKLPLKEAFAKSLDTCKKYSGLVFQLVSRVLEKKVSIKAFSSPVRMASFAGQAAMEPGWTPLLYTLALISLQLAIFNLLPIPILDGGLMLMMLIEGVIRRDIKQEIKERVYQAAFVCIMLFAAVVIFNDVVKKLHGW